MPSHQSESSILPAAYMAEDPRNSPFRRKLVQLVLINDFCAPDVLIDSTVLLQRDFVTSNFHSKTAACRLL